MKQPKILFLVVIALLPLILVSCISGSAQLARGWSGTTIHEGIIYAGTFDGRVVAINSSSRLQKWDYQFTTPSGGAACAPGVVSAAIYTTPIVDGNFVYIGTYSGNTYALSTATGARRWFYPEVGNMGAIVGSPVLYDATLYISSSDGTVYALDTGDGDLRWEDRLKWQSDPSHPLAEKLWTSPTVVGDTLYVSTFDGHIYALSLETGELLDWSFESEAGFASSPVIDEDTIFLGSFDRYFYAVKIGSDVPTWKFPQEEPAGNWFWASPIVNEGVVYAGCLDGKLYAIDAETGEELWQFESRDTQGKSVPIVASPVLMDNLLIVTDESGTVYVFDLSAELEDEAMPLKVISIGAYVRSSFCAQEGLVYIRGEDNQLYVVDIDMGAVSWNVSLTIEE